MAAVESELVAVAAAVVAVSLSFPKQPPFSSYLEWIDTGLHVDRLHYNLEILQLDKCHRSRMFVVVPEQEVFVAVFAMAVEE